MEEKKNLEQENKNQEPKENKESLSKPDKPDKESDKLDKEESKTVTLSGAEYAQLREKAEKSLEYAEKILRLQADFDNARKRLEREKQEFIQYANEPLLCDLLKIVDDLERSLELALPQQKEQKELSSFFQGMHIILGNLKELLKKYGVVPMETKGKIFNPKFHEALLKKEREDVPENTILEEYQKGYMIYNRVLRVARVQISSKKEVSQEEANTNPESKKKEETESKKKEETESKKKE